VKFCISFVSDIPLLVVDELSCINSLLSDGVSEITKKIGTKSDAFHYHNNPYKEIR